MLCFCRILMKADVAFMLKPTGGKGSVYLKSQPAERVSFLVEVTD